MVPWPRPPLSAVSRSLAAGRRSNLPCRREAPQPRHPLQMDPFGRLRVWRACFAAAGRLPPRALGGRRGMAVRFDADSEEVSDTIEKHLVRHW